MLSAVVEFTPHIAGELLVPADKSMCHRAVMVSSIAEGNSEIVGDFDGNDVRATMNIMRSMGVSIHKSHSRKVKVEGVGLHGLKAPAEFLNCQRSGTSMRLLAGLLSGQLFSSVLDGDEQLLKRPMDRVVVPLNIFGAEISGCESRGDKSLRVTTGPLHVPGRKLVGTSYNLLIPSAQIKSALLFAGLYSSGTTVIQENAPCRNHTELMLQQFGAQVSTQRSLITMVPGAPLKAQYVDIPGDISSAAFFIGLAAIHENSSVHIKSVGVNNTRTGFIDALVKMGTKLSRENSSVCSGEGVADLSIRGAGLAAMDFSGVDIVRMIDELPILAVVATQARGTLTVRDAAELKVKESNRIHSIVCELRKMGAEIEELADGYLVEGGHLLKGCVVDSHGDHRIAMALIIAGTIAEGQTTVNNCESIADSFPTFFSCLKQVGVNCELRD